jgi:DNA-binding NarL/FixJ family response regulator
MSDSISDNGYYARSSQTSGQHVQENYATYEAKQKAIKFLIVDDYVLLREGLVALLDKVPDIQVVGRCSDTRSGIYMIEKLEPDVILVDISMAGTSPFELARRAKILHPASKVLFFVKEITDSSIEQGLRCGAYGFITKSESIEGIMSAIRKAKEGTKYFSEEIRNRIIANHSIDPNHDNYAPRRSLLSPREIEVLCCVARGMKAKVIGKTLHITAKTVERHKSNIMAKLGLHSQVDLAIYAIKEGYVTL